MKPLKVKYYHLDEDLKGKVVESFQIKSIEFGGLRPVAIVRYDNVECPIGKGLGVLAEYVGVRDIDGNEIYEGDVVESTFLGRAVVMWGFTDACWGTLSASHGWRPNILDCETAKVVDNVHREGDDFHTLTEFLLVK